MTETETVQVSPETRTWAARMIEQFRAVEALHSPQPRWQIIGHEEGSSWVDKDDALVALHEGTYEWDGQPDAGEEQLCFFLVCGECARIEADFADEQFPDANTWTYQSSMWPCLTGRALGRDRESS